MDAKRYLEQYTKIDAVILNKTVEAEQWEALAQTITAQMGGERVQSSGSQQKMADAIDKCIDIKAEIEKLVNKKKEIVNTIEELPMAEYDILHKVYIQGKNFKEIQVEGINTYSWVTTTHGRALHNLQKMLDEREKG